MHRTGVGLSYTDVMRQNKRFCEDTRKDSKIAPSTIPKKQPTHVTIDNSDGRQQTLTGLATTRHTYSTIYVPKIINDYGTQESLSEYLESPSLIDCPINAYSLKDHLYRERSNLNDYKIWTRSEPPILTESKTLANRNFLEERLDVDLAWCMAANLNDDEIQTPPFGSWTVFNSMVTNKRTIKSDFLPVIPHPPNDSILKDYLDFLIDNIFCHSDQDVFSQNFANNVERKEI